MEKYTWRYSSVIQRIVINCVMKRLLLVINRDGEIYIYSITTKYKCTSRSEKY